MTIRPTPLSLNVSTTVPQGPPEPSHGVVDVRGLLDGLNDVPLTWSDDVLEEISRLGEGAGGAVHKVKDKRTGKIIARKTITTREAPMKQLLRELSIISSTQHVNIILFHGAYMSPSSSEVKILMEYCEGGSLETVGKRIKERGAVVGEKIAGRLAEGVSPLPLDLSDRVNDVPHNRFCKALLICTLRRRSIGILNHPTYYYLEKGLSSCVISVFLVNSWTPLLAHSREPVFTWLSVCFRLSSGLTMISHSFNYVVARANLRRRVYHTVRCVVDGDFSAGTRTKPISFSQRSPSDRIDDVHYDR